MTNTSIQKYLAGFVHIYTAMGSVIAFVMILTALKGDTTGFLWLTLIAMVIDGTDGFLARKFDVKKNIPWFDGATLDNIVDYLTYVFAPVVLLWTNNYLPQNTAGLIIVSAVLLSSCYQFCRSDAKTDNKNYYFLGFPDYWNIIAFYAIVAGLSPNTTLLILLVCAILVFVPIKFLYPSRTKQYQKITVPLTILWFIAFLVIMMQLPNPNQGLVQLSLIYPIYYFLASIYLTLQIK
ncbi:MAG: CDP-diacylglycerol O-phosphatidyltransferase [bacterium]|nr:CDP-diacylglycerol O-phosphatidyltransferase [bacterium]